MSTPTPVPIEQLRREVPQEWLCLVDFLAHARAFRTVVQGQPALDLMEAAEAYVRDQRQHAVALLSELAAGHLLTYGAHPGMRFVRAVRVSRDPLPALPAAALPSAMPRLDEAAPAAPAIAPAQGLPPQMRPPYWERNRAPSLRALLASLGRCWLYVFASMGCYHWLVWLCGGAA